MIQIFEHQNLMLHFVFLYYFGELLLRNIKINIESYAALDFA